MCEVLNKHCEIGYFVTLVINIIKIAVPVVLVIMGMLDFAKASTKGNADDMAKTRNIFLKRCIAGATTFFVIAIVQLAIIIVAKATSGQEESNNSIWQCVESLINYKGNC